jgi:hypothetical protein
VGKVESLIFDPFGRAYSGSSQNDAGEVGARAPSTHAPAPTHHREELTHHREELTHDHHTVRELPVRELGQRPRQAVLPMPGQWRA